MHDFRYTLRFLWLNKPFTAAAVLTLAVGLGANTALFGLLNGAMRPLAVPQADRIVVIASKSRATKAADSIRVLQGAAWRTCSTGRSPSPTWSR